MKEIEVSNCIAKLMQVDIVILNYLLFFRPEYHASPLALQPKPL